MANSAERRGSCYVPRLLLRLGLQEPGADMRVESVEAALFFLDISGFVSLSSQLEEADALTEDGTGEAVRRALNRFFASVVTELERCGADVLKFAGDALIACWPVVQPEEGQDLRSVVLQAVHAGLHVHKCFDSFDVGIPDRPLHSKITVTAGTMQCLHIGGFQDRWEFVPAGSPLNEIMQYGPITKPLEVALSPSAAALIGDNARISYDSERNVTLVNQMLVSPPPVVDIVGSTVVSSPMLQGYIPEAARSQLSSHPLAESASMNAELQQSEIRQLAVCFVNFMPSSSRQEVQQLIESAHDALVHLQEIMVRHDGDLRQALLEDKGWTAIFLWGVPGKSHEDDGLRALAAASEMEAALRNAGWLPFIGITYGEVFCGNVGTLRRCEYSATGPLVNLSARLMTANGPDGGILCTAEVMNEAKSWTSFKFVGNLKVKGRQQSVAAFQPLPSDQDASTAGSCSSPDEDMQVSPAISSSDEESATWAPHNRCFQKIKEYVYQTIDYAMPAVIEVRGETYSGKTTLYSSVDSFARSAKMLVLSPTLSDNRQRGARKDIFDHICKEILGRKVTTADALELLQLLDDECKQQNTKVFQPQRMSNVLATKVGACTFSDLEPLVQSAGFGKNSLDNSITERIPRPLHEEIFLEAILLSLVRFLVRTRSIALLLDNAESSDDFLWLFIRGLAQLRDAAVDVVLFVRDDAGLESVNDVSTRDLNAPVGPQVLIRVELEALSRSELAAMVIERKCTQCKRVQDVILDFLQERSRGIPPFAAFMADELVRHNLLYVHNYQVRMDSHKVNRYRSSKLIPSSIASVVRVRLDRVSARAMLVAKVAALFGIVWSIDEVLALLSGRSGFDGPIQEDVEELERNGIVQSLGSNTFTFKSPSYANVAYELLPMGQRKHLHSQAAQLSEEVLARQKDNDTMHDGHGLYTPFDNFVKLARHRFYGGEKDKAAIAYLEASREGFAQGEYAGTAECARHCIALVTELGVNDPGWSKSDIGELFLTEAESSFRRKFQETERSNRLALTAIEYIEEDLFATVGSKLFQQLLADVNCSGKPRDREQLERKAFLFCEALCHGAKYAFYASQFRLGYAIMKRLKNALSWKSYMRGHYKISHDILVAFCQAVDGWKAARSLAGRKPLRSGVGSNASETVQSFRALMIAMQFSGYPSRMIQFYRLASAHSNGDSATLRLATYGIAASNYLRAQFVRSDELHKEILLQDSSDGPPYALLVATIGFVGTRVRTRRISDALGGVRKFQEILRRHHLAAGHLPVGQKYYYALLALVYARAKQFSEALDACIRCLHIFRDEDGVMLENWTTAVQVRQSQ